MDIRIIREIEDLRDVAVGRPILVGSTRIEVCGEDPTKVLAAFNQINSQIKGKEETTK